MTWALGEAVETSQVVHLRIPANLRYLNIACACVTAACERLEPTVEPSFIQSIELAVQEACTNIVQHAYDGIDDGMIDLVMLLLPDEVVVELRDLGASFDSAAAPLPDFEIVQERGFGLFLIRQLVDETEYSSKDGENRLRLRKKLNP